MDGRGRAMDNVFIERLWRSVKYEEVYLRDYTDGWHAESVAGRVLPLLQRGADPPGARLPHARRGLLPTRLKRREAARTKIELKSRKKNDSWLAHQKLKQLQRPRGTYGGPAGRQLYLIQPVWAPNQWGPPQADDIVKSNDL